MYKKLNQLRDLLETTRGLTFFGTCDVGMGASTTAIVCAELANLGDDLFNLGWTMVVLKNANSVGNAPENQFRDITNYVSSTGTFTTAAFGANVEASDEICIMKNELADWADGQRLDLILDIIAVDVAGLNGDAMVGTNGAALAASWTAGLATILANFTPARIGYLDELDFDLTAALAALPDEAYLDAIELAIRGADSDTLETLSDQLDTIAGGIGSATIANQNQILDGTNDRSGGHSSATDNLHDISDQVAAIPTVMVGTNNAALAASWTAGLATALGNYTAGRAAYLDELAAANLPSDIDDILADTGALDTRLTAIRAGYLDELDFDLTAAISAIPTVMVGTNGAALAASWTSALATALGAYTAARGAYLDELDFDLQTAIAAIPTVMVGTNGAALAASWTAGLATALGAYTAARGGYLDELAAGNIPTDLSNIDAAVVVIDAFHDVAVANAVTNTVMSDVIGNKTDVAVQDGDATEKTIIALVKGLHDVLWDADGVAAWAAAAAPANGVSVAEVIRAIYDDSDILQSEWANGGRLDVLLDTAAAGGSQDPFRTTIDLHQGAATYDICTATGQDIIIDALMFSPQDDISDDATGITAVTIQTNTTTEQEFMDNVDGAIVNLTAEAQYSWVGAIMVRQNDKIQFTIEGGAANAEPSTCDITIKYTPVVAGGTLVA